LQVVEEEVMMLLVAVVQEVIVQILDLVLLLKRIL
jgi:hypothetical protein|tara:strand:- start:472 stop:576 length:105 start_codon:yes stop_codon:yes gene_type:complete